MRTLKSKHIVSNILYAVWTGIEALIVGGFLVFMNIVGGSADYIESGKYFISNHGIVKETSAWIYHLLQVWEVIFWISVPIYILGCFFIVYLSQRKRNGN